MIKKWSQFNESKAEKPGENIPGSVKVNLTDEDVNAFTDNTSLQKLISDDKVALLDGEAWYWEDDMTTKGILDQYLEIPGTVEEEPTGDLVSENFQWSDDEINKLEIDIHDEIAKGMTKEEFLEYSSSYSFGMGEVFEVLKKWAFRP
jgi:hypothetical protein